MEVERNSLKKREKFRTRKEFDTLKEHGKAWRDPFFTVLVQAPGTDNLPEFPRFGVICSRKLHHSAVIRNRMRRLVSETFRLCKRSILPCGMLVIPRRAMFGAKRQEVEDHLLRTLKKAGLLRSPGENPPSTPPLSR